MSLLDDLAESRIVAAQARGELDDLPAAGKPVQIDDDSLIAPEWRMAYRVLRNAGYLPREVSLRRELGQIEALLAELSQPDERQRALGRLQYLRLALSANRYSRSLWLDEAEYCQRILDKLEGRDDQ